MKERNTELNSRIKILIDKVKIIEKDTHSKAVRYDKMLDEKNRTQKITTKMLNSHNDNATSDRIRDFRTKGFKKCRPSKNKKRKMQKKKYRKKEKKTKYYDSSSSESSSEEDIRIPHSLKRTDCSDLFDPPMWIVQLLTMKISSLQRIPSFNRSDTNYAKRIALPVSSITQ